MISARTHDKSRTRASVCEAGRNNIFKIFIARKKLCLKRLIKLLGGKFVPPLANPTNTKNGYFANSTLQN